MDNEEALHILAFFQTMERHAPLYLMEIKMELQGQITKYVTALVNSPAKMAAEDIKVTELVMPFIVDEVNGHNLVTQRLSCGVVAD
jgi:hypothetical protein